MLDTLQVLAGVTVADILPADASDLAEPRVRRWDHQIVGRGKGHQEATKGAIRAITLPHILGKKGSELEDILQIPLVISRPALLPDLVTVDRGAGPHCTGDKAAARTRWAGPMGRVYRGRNENETPLPVGCNDEQTA